jgi:putative hydrolase of the HAD superfamily
MYLKRLPEFLQANLSRDEAQGNAFWHRLTCDWLRALGLPETHCHPLREAADKLGFGPDSILFRPFDDVLPCLDALEKIGIRMAVVSNWDYSLHRVLRDFGLYDRFEAVVASLEEGVEKPDPRLFHLTLERMGARPEETLHVGDNPEDDVEGARAAGLRALLLDRTGTLEPPRAIHTLAQLPEALSWSV